MPKLFRLHRYEDPTGVSGTGDVAWGVEFPDGVCCVHWMTTHRSTTVYTSLRDVEAIHLHHGATELVWL